jgi:hypothetical protein
VRFAVSNVHIGSAMSTIESKDQGSMLGFCKYLCRLPTIPECSFLNGFSCLHMYIQEKINA